MRRTAVISVLALALSLVGCSSATLAASSPSPSKTATPLASPTKEALPAVSLETTCDLIFGSNVDGPMVDAQDIIARFVANPDLSTVSEEEIVAARDAIETAARSANEDLVPYLNAQVAPLDQLLDALKRGVNSTVDFDEYKASGLELINQCEPYL